ncbi:hypothetical protein PC117_g16943 [Phytophthora cactorum]|uniref:Uncharacterized protein n=1 Tax=Phytophthora cactorum TaxID=29920 RepID=A0A8T1CC51_9STRA|nr:hypothetical protein PC117_g16943 [Phytophthora cactorum]
MLPTNIHESIWADMSVHPSTSIHPPRARSRRFRCEFSNNADVASSSRFVLVSIKAVSCRFRAGFVQVSCTCTLMPLSSHCVTIDPARISIA